MVTPNIGNNNNNISAKDLTKAYSLHPSNDFGLLLVSTAFDGNGFGSWKRAMPISLSTKRSYTLLMAASQGLNQIH